MPRVLIDPFTRDEAMSDSFPWVEINDEEGNPTGLIQVQSKIVGKGGESFDTGGGNAFGGGEEQETDDTVEKVNNFIDEGVGFGYNEMAFSKKAEMKDYLKGIMQRTRKHHKQSGTTTKYLVNGKAAEGEKFASNEEFMADFKAKAPLAAKWLMSHYKDLTAYALKSFDCEANMVFEYWDDESNASGAPKFVMFALGFAMEKY